MRLRYGFTVEVRFVFPPSGRVRIRMPERQFGHPSARGFKVSDVPTFVDLFAGVGGLTAGLERSGWTNLLAVERWADAVETYRANFPGHDVYSDDIKLLSTSELSRRVAGDIDLVAGGPPCQGWSTVGKRQWDDDRNDLFTEFMRVVRVLRPKMFLIENVVGLKDMRAVEAVQELFAGTGYAVSPQLVRAGDFGVPQLRKRMLFVGHRDGIHFAPLTPTWLEPRTVWEAIGDLPVVGPGQTATAYDQPAHNGFQRAMRQGSHGLQGHTVSKHPAHLVEAISHIPDGGNRRSIPDRLQPRSGFHNSYSRLASWLPAVAVTSNMGKPSATRCIHPFQDRGLTAREGARLQTFPDRFHFSGGIVSQRLQIANAVPPFLAEGIGRALLDDRSWWEEPVTERATLHAKLA